MSDRLLTLFLEYNRSPFLFVEPGGNYGDSLIYKGAYKLAESADLDYEVLSHESYMRGEFKKDAIVYIHGSGGFVPIWSGTPIAELEKAVASAHRVIIVGPQTVWPDDTFLHDRVARVVNEAKSQDIFFHVRECVSYEAVVRNLPSFVTVVLEHDTALNLGREDFLADRDEEEDGTRYSGRRGAYTLYAIREDKEAQGRCRRDPFAVWLDPVKESRSFVEWVKLHQGARAIVTNRLHSAICGCVLGLPTTLVANSYHKNRAVWEFSLRGRGVKWLDRAENSIMGDLANRLGPTRWFFSRGPVRRFIYRRLGLR